MELQRRDGTGRAVSRSRGGGTAGRSHLGPGRAGERGTRRRRLLVRGVPAAGHDAAAAGGDGRGADTRRRGRADRPGAGAVRSRVPNGPRPPAPGSRPATAGPRDHAGHPLPEPRGGGCRRPRARVRPRRRSAGPGRAEIPAGTPAGARGQPASGPARATRDRARRAPPRARVRPGRRSAGPGRAEEPRSGRRPEPLGAGVRGPTRSTASGAGELPYVFRTPRSRTEPTASGAGGADGVGGTRRRRSRTESAASDAGGLPYVLRTPDEAERSRRHQAPEEPGGVRRRRAAARSPGPSPRSSWSSRPG